MKVLILHQHFKTPDEGGALRSWFLAKALLQRGHTVTVVTGADRGGSTKKHIEGIEVHYLPVSYSNHFGFWKRIFSFIKFNVAFGWRASEFKNYNLCYAISVPLTIGLAARWLRYRHQVPYVFEVGDLWPDAAIELGVIKNNWLKKYLWHLERSTYEKALAIVPLSPAIEQAIEKKLPGKKMLVVPNMADTDFYKPEAKQPQWEEKFSVRGKLVISYLGAMGFANGLEYLLDCAVVCSEQNLPVHFMLAGDGAERKSLMERADKLKLNNLSFIDFQNRSGVHELMNVTDVVFVCYRHAAILETGSPNKFFDGLAAGKLILINFGGWIKNEIETANCGFYVDPTNPKAIVTIIKNIELNNNLKQYQQQARLLAEKKFSRQQLTGEWVNFLEKVVAANSPA